MIVVMNVVNAAEGRAEEFEQAFLSRESYLNQAEGFAGFELLRRDRDGEYIVLSRWETREAFQNWVKSDLFKRSHSHLERRDVTPPAHGNEVRTYEVLDLEVPA